MSENKSFVSRIYSEIKDNLSIILIIPAFLGGLWQIIELWSISMPYVRFFSISQIVPDGLLILIFLTIAFVPFFAGLLFSAYFVHDEDRQPDTKTKLSQNQYLGTFCFISFIAGGYLYAIYQGLVTYLNLSSVVVIFAVLIGLLCFVITECYKIANKSIKRYLGICTVFTILLSFLFLYILGNMMHKSFLVTDDLNNIRNIDKIIEDKFPNTSQEILYFNDKYIFVRVTNKIENKTGESVDKVCILKIDELFDK